MTESLTDDMLKRRAESITALNASDKIRLHTDPERQAFFETVYENANGDPALIPWADLQAKPELVAWLEDTDPKGEAIDIACGLGDNAEAISAAGWSTTGFDISGDAINWAKDRFPNSQVSYQQADLFDLPTDWSRRFALVHECYTLQAMPPETLERTVPAIADLVAPDGHLLIYTRIREDGAAVDGPPWPLEESVLNDFKTQGLILTARKNFDFQKEDRIIPHAWMVWRRPAKGSL